MHARFVVLAIAGVLAAGPASAREVALHGMLGHKALVVIDGGQPRALAVGQTERGVRLLSMHGDSAVVMVEGREMTLRIGQAPLDTRPAAASANSSLILYANPAGHFLADGHVNGRSTHFLVDTGASYVALGETEAERLGLDWRRGQPVRMHTANGEADGRLIRLREVRVGEVVAHGVDAVVTPMGMPFVLLGNSFLNRFDMERRGSQMLLSSR